jgi:hypothetical protein
MTLEQALKAEIGDILFSVFTSSNYKENDQVILVERARDINGNENDTGGWFYHRQKKECFGGNIQDFRYEAIP